MTVTSATDAAYVLPTLEKFRKKLLDLSAARNSLLDLKFSKPKSLRLLRFVDCNPQVVLNGLISGRQYSISALPELPKGRQRDVDDAALEIALEAARDEDLLDQKIPSGDGGDAVRQLALEQASDRSTMVLPDEQEIKSTSAQTGRGLIAWAEQHGINPSYSLSHTSEATADKGTLQVLQFEPRMEKIAETIRKQAQSSIEESGNNILYIAFGCLQWKEKEKLLHAPLILLPVEITKTAGRGGAKTFYISASDDAPIANITLKERLRGDFGIDLPMPDLLDDPFQLEPYFKQVAESVSKLPEWGVENYLNLALFNFGGLELYEDFKPEAIASSSLVRQLLSAEVGENELPDSTPLVAEDVHVDHPDIADRVPVLIAQADASQFAAVADVMAGRSMVIEGPPGTGKSQTITNIIANALYAGKRVLFVAEKKVALDVVYYRLSEAGLKPYCLRVESDKANKKQIYDELTDRIDLPAPQSPRRDPVNAAFSDIREELNGFAALLNQPFGEEEHSQHDLLWQELQLRRELMAAGVDTTPVQMEITEACANGRQRIEQHSQIVEELAHLFDGLDRSKIQAVFEPLTVLPADALGRDVLLDQAGQWASALLSLMAELRANTGAGELTLVQLRDQAQVWVEQIGRLPDPLPMQAEVLLPVLGSPAMAGIAQALLDALRADVDASAALTARFIRLPDPLPNTEAIQSFVALASRWRLGEQGLPANAAGREALRDQLNRLVQRADRLDVLLQTASQGFSFAGLTPSTLEALLPLVDHLSAQPEWVLRQRQEAVWQCDPSRVRSLLQEHSRLQGLRLELKLDRAKAQEAVDVSLPAAIDQLKRCCERGLSDVLAKANSADIRRRQLDQAKTLLDDVTSGLHEVLPSVLIDAATVEQLLTLPDLLRRVLALEGDACDLRASTLWQADLNSIGQSLEGERTLHERERALQQAGLCVVADHSANELREAAELLENRPLFKRVVNKLSGSSGRARNLTQAIGVTDPDQRVKALRDVAEVIELQQSYGTGWQQRKLGVELPSERLLSVAEQLQQLRIELETCAQGPFWLRWLRETPAAALEEALKRLEQGLGAKLDALSRDCIWTKAVSNRGLSALRELLNQSSQDQALLADVEPVACWARAAGLLQGTAMVEWLQRVEEYKKCQAQFPQQDLDALLTSNLKFDQLEAVLGAAEQTRSISAASGLGREIDELMSIDQSALNQALLTLRHQLPPLVRELLEQPDLLPDDARQRPLAALAEAVQQNAEAYQDLLLQWQELGLRADLQLQDLLPLPLDLALARRRRDEVQQALARFKDQAGDVVAATPPELLRQVMSWIMVVHQAGLARDLEDRCLQEGSGNVINEHRAAAERLAAAVAVETTAAEAFLDIAKPQAAVVSGGSCQIIESLQASELQEWLTQVVHHREHYPIWVRRHQLLDQLPTTGQRQLADQLLTTDLPVEQWSKIYRWMLVRSQLRQMAQAIPELQLLRSAEQVARRERFQRMEDELRELDRAAVVAAIHRDPYALPQGVNKGLKRDFTEMALIQNESGKQKRHRPLRHLFQSAGDSLRGLKPCWMVSPGTLASLVPREGIDQFDLVIVDEASQMPPERALGLISRARQCVVVGDPKQLPPTSFFRRTAAMDDDQFDDEIDNEVLDEESILDLCTKTFKPVRRLKWHYRSRHGSLIAFSNKFFYNSELVVFPACDRDFAIHRHLVGDPSYGKGINLPEVTLVCDVVLEQLERYPERSLGVVAMNEAQASEIEERLEKFASYHDELGRRLAIKDASESLFVKALEKVQGDERDTIVISTTYGPPAPGGRVGMNFGPINKDGGHRRLNVLFTRAKRAIELVTSIESHQIQSELTSSQGTQAFRNYLKFVESQSLESGRPSGREPDSPFEVVVAEAIQRHGYEVDCQVGVANYFIDLAIRHPDRPDAYLLGVECDGATYHSARAARDRDKYRQSVLEGLGWQIYRIWSTDWFENAEAETRKLIDHLSSISSK
jgi:very-short-patch-repair endonuclease